MNILKNTKALIALSVVVAAIGGSQVYACRDTFAALAHEKTETKSVAKKETSEKKVSSSVKKESSSESSATETSSVSESSSSVAQSSSVASSSSDAQSSSQATTQANGNAAIFANGTESVRIVSDDAGSVPIATVFFTATGSNERILPEWTFISDQKLQRYGFGSGRRQRLCLDISSELLFV